MKLDSIIDDFEDDLQKERGEEGGGVQKNKRVIASRSDVLREGGSDRFMMVAIRTPCPIYNRN